MDHKIQFLIIYLKKAKKVHAIKDHSCSICYSDLHVYDK